MAMSTVAAGAYLALLRDENTSYSQVSIAKQLGTSKSQIQRIEGGGGETRTSLLLAFNRLVGGNVNHIADLLLDEKATAEDGRKKAQEILSQGSYRRATQIADRIPDENVDIAVLFLRALQETPGALAELKQLLKDFDEEGDTQQH